MNPFRTASNRLAPFALVAVLLHVNALAAADFLVKSVDYPIEDGDKAIIILNAKIPANDQAEVVIVSQGEDAAVVTAETADVVASLRSSHPATVKTVMTSSGSPKITTGTVTVTVSSQAGADVSVSYRCAATNSPTFHYDLDLDIVRSNDQSDNQSAVINGFVTIRNDSRSNAKWSDTQVTIRRESGDVQLQGITIPHNATPNPAVQGFTIVPLPKVVNYAVSVTEKPYLKAKAGNSVHEVYNVKKRDNSSEPALLPRSDQVHIFRGRQLTDGELKNGQFVVFGELENDETLGTSVDIFTNQVSSVTITESTEEQCYEALSLVNGILKCQFWSVTERELENESDADVNVLLEGETKPVPVPPNDTVELPDQLGEKGKEDELILYDVEKEKKFDEELGQLQVFSDDAPKDKVAPIAAVFARIVELDAEVTALEAEKTATDERLKKLREAGPPSALPDAASEPGVPSEEVPAPQPDPDPAPQPEPESVTPIPDETTSPRNWQDILDHLEKRSQDLQKQIEEKRSEQHNLRWGLLQLLFPEIPAQAPAP